MYVYGKNVVKELINNKQKINKAFVYENFNDKEILDYLSKTNVNVTYLNKVEIDKKVDGNHQGIILSIDDFKYAQLDELLVKENPLLVILDHIEDPHNFGAIIRTCEAAGVDGIIIPKNRSVEVNSTVMRVSTGALDNIKVSMVTNLKSTIDYLKKQGFWVIGTDMEGTDYTKIDYTGKTVIITGNEGAGLSRIVKESCDFIASIGMKGKVNSLNASVATGIVIFEAIKKRG